MAQTIQRSFTGGEIAPSLRSRADLVKYSTGLALCKDFIVRSQGGIYSRPGFRFIGAVGQSSRKARLIPFSFNTEQTYILVFEHLTMRVIKDGGFVQSGGSTYQIATPYTEAELPRLGFIQDADVMTIVHPNHDIRNLSRTGHDAWALTTVDYTPPITPPTFLTRQGTVDISDISTDGNGITTVTTAVAHSFSTDQVILIHGDITFSSVAASWDPEGRSFEIVKVGDAKFYLKKKLDSNDPEENALLNWTGGGKASRDGILAFGDGAGDFEKTYNYVITAVNADGVESVASTSRSITTPSLSPTAGVRLEWSTVTGADYYRVYKDPSNGTGIYGWIGNSSTNSFDDYNTAPITSDAPPTDRTPLSGAGNRPATVGYYQQRQVFANTTNEPQTVFTTQTAVYNSFRTSVPARADDAITFTIKGRQVNEIRHIIALDALILLTSGAEWRVTEGQDEVLTPSTVGTRIQSYNGASWVPPEVIGDTVVYVQEKGARIRDIKYEFVDDKYSGNDLSIMAEHLFEGCDIIEMAYAAEPYGILWAVRSDGVLLGMTYQREHQVWAWHQHTTDGEFESVAVISEDGRDATYATVKRIINGSVKRYVERLEPRFTSSAEDVFCVDSGLSYDGTATDTFSGLGHLEGKSVVAVADGNVVSNLTVSGGQVTLPRAASKVHIGLPYTPAVELLDIDVSSMVETLKGREVSVSSVILEVEKSRGGWVGPKTDDGSTGTMVEIKPRFDADGYGSISLKTFKQEVTIEPQWSKGGGIRIEQRAPMPLAILSVIPEIDVS